MYKSRLHTWGLDKKKKEHEMLDLVRQGLSHGGADKDKVFVVRGKEVTLADALHYFNRKGIKDPASLLESNGDIRMQRDDSSPEDFDVQTPLSSRGDNLDITNPLSDSDYDMPQSPDMTLVSLNPERIEYLKSADLASEPRRADRADDPGRGASPWRTSVRGSALRPVRRLAHAIAGGAEGAGVRRLSRLASQPGHHRGRNPG